ncbi:Serine/threonine-protein kinase ppk19 [Hypsizygus marmoreus]|uniref:non-specific serine/threonine protein kinase n=1 Tax=Hypsizygus marmoreus TaxID=39966 RepID=A0A369JTH8_HYPMA|nr:Serine/threonine-protein kinase ppk19 [Hypsizygus marmoreus]
MGNIHSGSTLTRTTGALDSFVAELGGDIIYEKSLGSARFLKSVKCRHRNGFMVIKVFIKPDPGLSLRTYHRRLKMDREALLDIANVYNYQAFVETDKAGYIIRQWIASNLYDRISTRPFLSMIEKRWIAFQLLNALRDARNRKVSHGDIKSENILVTSWNWVYLSDFASYKPTYLPLDDPSDFSFFFDTSGRRTCYIAPERFYTASTNPEISAKKSKLAMDENEGKRDGKVTEAMDCFSAGCVIAELFLEGAPLFTLSQLFKYREGEFSVEAQLLSIDDEGVRSLIKQMINLDPTARPTFDTLLHTSRGSVFPESFYSFLHNYVSSINDLPHNTPFNTPSPPTAPSTAPSSIMPSTSGSTLRPGSSLGQAANAPSADTSPEPLPSDSDNRLEKLWADYESVEPYLTPESNEEEPPMNVKLEYTTVTTSVSKPFQDILPVELHIPNRESELESALGGPRAASEDGPALIILALVTANIRNCSVPTSKIRALDVFLALSRHLTDEAKLDRMVPYIVELLHDEAAIVRSAALRTLMQVLMLVTVITPSNAAIFPEYIIPNIKYIVQDLEVSVRCTYAQCIAQLADTAVRYLEMGQALKAHGTFRLSAEAQEYDQGHFEVSYDASMQDLQNSIQDHLSSLLMDPSSIVKRAVLHDISSLCIFLGRQKTNDVLLSHMITYLNDRDWLLRHAFFESIVDVAACAGGRSLEEYILPLMIQALSDVEETVVAKVLATLTSLCELGLFQKMRIWELMSATLGFLYHPNEWIRQGSAAFIASAAKHLPPSDVWCILYPSLRHFLKCDVAVIDEQRLLTAMKPPLPRQILDASVQWAMKSDKTSFWRGSRRTTKMESPRESVVSMRKSGTTIARNKSEEDETQLTKLQQLGMTSSEESKLLAMRDYILKLANATSSFASRLISDPETGRSLKVIGDVELQKLGVVPQTVFLKTRTSDFAPPRSSRIHSSRRSTFGDSGRTPILSPRLSSADHSSAGTPFEDLRRRLATINGSVSSVGLGHPSPRGTFSPTVGGPPTASTSTSTNHNISGLPVTQERPGSPTESILSTANSQTFRPTSRLQIGSTDGQKAAPAVGSSRANATGLLDAHSKIISEDSPDLSGRSSPMSMSTTLRGPQRPRFPSIVPISTYDGQEPGISNLLENLYLDNNRELQHDFGPKVHEGPIRRRGAIRHPFGSREGTARPTEATLIAHLSSHSDAITSLAVSPDHMFFVSASDDKTVKVWDTARLERNVTSKPRHTYGQHHARVKCVCILEGVHCFASAADDGSLHVVRVHITQSGALPKYNKLQVIREHRFDTVGEYITCMTHYNTDAYSNLVYATTHSVITVLDLRTMQVMQTMENPRHFGPVTCLCIDRKRSWIVVGTSTGVLTLWDRRFGLLIKSWHVGVASTGRSVRIHQCVVHPSKGKGKWVMVSMESSRRTADRSSTNLVEVWDIEKAVLMETFVTRIGSTTESVPEPHELTGVDADSSPAAAIAALVRSRQPGGDPGDTRPRMSSRSTSSNTTELLPTPAPDVRAFIVGLDLGGHSTSHRSEYGELGVEGAPSLRATGRGYMVTGSEDRKIRLWDLGRLERTTVLSGLESETEKPTYQTSSVGTAATYVETWPIPSSNGGTTNRPPQRMSLITHSQQNLLKSHQDVITALASIESPFRGGIISGDRAGVVKVWRLEQGE